MTPRLKILIIMKSSSRSPFKETRHPLRHLTPPPPHPHQPRQHLRLLLFPKDRNRQQPTPAAREQRALRRHHLALSPNPQLLNPDRRRNRLLSTGSVWPDTTTTTATKVPPVEVPRAPRAVPLGCGTARVPRGLLPSVPSPRLSLPLNDSHRPLATPSVPRTPRVPTSRSTRSASTEPIQRFSSTPC